MKQSQEKYKRMAYVARRYYLEDQKQSDIARELGISRPMVSRILTQARELGVVEITIHDGESRTNSLLERLRRFCPSGAACWWRTERTAMPPTACSPRGRWSCWDSWAPAALGWAGDI